MQSIGALMAVLGAGSFVLNLVGREFVFLAWIDYWGPTVGTAIRIGLIVVGGGLWYAGRNQQAPAE